MSSPEARGRLRRVVLAVRLLLTVQARSRFLHVYFGVAVATILLYRLWIPRSWYPYAVPAVLLGEYSTMGIFMTGAHRYLERIEGSDLALVVTPLTPSEHAAAMVLAPALVATVAGTGVQAGVLGFDARTLLLVPPLFLTALVAGMTGILLSSRCREFTGFIVTSVPVVTLASLPYLSFFGVTPRWSFIWLPWDASLFSFGNLARPAPLPWVWALLVVVLVIFAIPVAFWAARSFRLHRQEEMM